MGFVSTWMKWIDASIFKCHWFILVNESPTKDFEVGRGLRQGDPLSPFLFLIIAKDLLGLIKKALDMGDFKWFKVDEETSVELIQFADDTVFIGGGGWKHLWSIKAFLRGFKPVSRQGVNFHKSRFICINKDPVRIWKDMDTIRQCFLWGGTEVKNNIHWVRWNDVCKEKDLVGLAIKSIKDFNLALLSKWQWKILEESNALWKRVLKARYGGIEHFVPFLSNLVLEL
ncbi:uncharacterized protein LOC127120978 [Lathyrus oleraceus]|uniref:uncharacterized protein LOC127120978 n=1 Tax=Pisum sativum TaxID=3888 RepID=UPI0021D29394|nr:uncharacterized protein LOC127120978 [Pisum sativum]